MTINREALLTRARQAEIDAFQARRAAADAASESDRDFAAAFAKGRAADAFRLRLQASNATE